MPHRYCWIDQHVLTVAYVGIDDRKPRRMRQLGERHGCRDQPFIGPDSPRMRHTELGHCHVVDPCAFRDVVRNEAKEVAGVTRLRGPPPGRVWNRRSVNTNRYQDREQEPNSGEKTEAETGLGKDSHQARRQTGWRMRL